jgi:hypothetical protein
VCGLFSSPLSLHTNSWLWLREVEAARAEDRCKVRTGRDPLSSVYIGISEPTEAWAEPPPHPVSKNQTQKMGFGSSNSAHARRNR